MKKKCTTKKWTFLFITLLSFVMLFSVNAFAKPRKLPKVICQYEEGRLVSKQTYSYDSKGNITKLVHYSNYTGEGKTTITKFKMTYWSKSSKYIKKMVVTSYNGEKIEFTFTKNGILKARTQRDASGKLLSTLKYKLKGNLPVSSVQKDIKGNVIAREQYDKHGNRTKRYVYENGVNKYTDTTKYTYGTNGKLKAKEKTVFNGNTGAVDGTELQEIDRKGTVSKETTRDINGEVESVINIVRTYNKAGYVTKKERISASSGDVLDTYEFTYTGKTYDRRQPENRYVWGIYIEYVLYE